MDLKAPFVDALIEELRIRRHFLGDDKRVETIYFGGGTPSQLSANDYDRIFSAIGEIYEVSSDAEITLEANPDDMTEVYVDSIRRLPFNRISMGVQSFDDEDLRFLNRRHNAKRAENAVRVCKEAGLYNISIDLIYGLPGQSVDAWRKNINKAISLDIPHISAYHLIYEEGTALYKLLEAGKIKPVDEDKSLDMFSVLIDTLGESGYEQYEISNFCKDNMYSRHNSSYWLGKKYLGLGPSAHSYNGNVRTWNVSSMDKYIKAIREGSPNFEVEELDTRTRYNDYVLTGLRTKWGVNLSVLCDRFGRDYMDYFIGIAKKYEAAGTLLVENEKVRLTRRGIFVSDGIMSDLMRV
jgi:oxygen-independent coproporphyrinogen-3 oxidase